MNKFESAAKLISKEAYEKKTWYTIRALLGHHDVN